MNKERYINKRDSLAIKQYPNTPLKIYATSDKEK